MTDRIAMGSTSAPACPANADPQVRAEQSFAPRIILNDCTLREGEQASEVNLSLDDRLRIAEALFKAGIPQIQAGYPGRSAIDFKTIGEIKRRFPGCTAEAVAQAFQKDWKEQIDLAINSGADWVDLMYPISDDRLKLVQRVSRDQMLERSVEAVSYACKRISNVRFAPTDTGRTDLDFLDTVYREVVRAGAKRVTVADTVGGLHPRAVALIVRRAVAAAGVPVQAHFHDDFGLALANSVAAAEAGATILDGTVLGIGERSGNTSMEELASALTLLYGVDTGVRLDALCGLATLVGELSNVKVPEHKAIVGSHAFSHKLEAHIMGVEINPSAYEPVPPETFGNLRHIELGRSSGPHGVKGRLRQVGICLENADVIDALVKEVRHTAENQRNSVTDQQLLDLLERARAGT